MFFHTDPRILRPIHSLLEKPFGFSAHVSMSGPLRQLLSSRTDYEHLLVLGHLYDQARQCAEARLTRLRPLLNDRYSFIVGSSSDTEHICRTTFKGPEPVLYGMSMGRYQSLVSVQCQLERLYDLMDLRHMGSRNALQDPEVVEILCLLMLNEALALCLAGIAKVHTAHGSFEFSVVDAAATNALRATWFARNVDQGSHTGTLVMAKFFADNGADSVNDLHILIHRILDQDLSIPWHRLQSEGHALQSSQEVFHAVALVAVAMVSEIRGQPLLMLGSELKKRGLDFGAVSRLLHRQSHALVTDRFVTRIGDTLKIRVESASKGLRCYYQRLEEEFNERDLMRRYTGGFFFERSHIRQRIEKGPDYQPRYRIIEGFDRNKVLEDGENEADVEFIIHDTQQDHYYFVQVKHALLGEKAFFASIVKAIQKDIGKGIHQLREAKRLLGRGQLDRTLAKRNVHGATSANCSFVLLHNIAQFDYQSTYDGISLYDWASFRNLLKDAEWTLGSSEGHHEIVRLRTPLVINHPMKVIDRLLAEHPAYMEVGKDVWINERASTTYSVLGRTVRLNGLGI